VVCWRTRADTLVCVPLSLVAVMFAASVGFMAVPAGPCAAHALLASAAAFSAAILLLRLTGCGTGCLTAAATVTALTTAVAGASLAWQLPTNAVGASLATLALAMLGLAPRLAVAVTGIGPPTPSIDDLREPPVITPARAAFAHRLLTGLVAGSSIAAALGAVAVALGQLRNGESTLIAVAFTAVAGLALVLRARMHADASRRITLVVSGIVGLTACFAIGVVTAPGHAYLFSAVAAAAGAAALSLCAGLTFGPLVRRAVEVVEYVALAAVIPLACWVGGLYGLVRGMSLI
jgi:type VII secretion integral membrane protein EccD